MCAEKSFTSTVLLLTLSSTPHRPRHARISPHLPFRIALLGKTHDPCVSQRLTTATRSYSHNDCRHFPATVWMFLMFAPEHPYTNDGRYVSCFLCGCLSIRKRLQHLTHIIFAVLPWSSDRKLSCSLPLIVSPRPRVTRSFLLDLLSSSTLLSWILFSRFSCIFPHTCSIVSSKFCSRLSNMPTNSILLTTIFPCEQKRYFCPRQCRWSLATIFSLRNSHTAKQV